MSFRKFNLDLKLVLATNEPPPDDIALSLQNIDVEIRFIQYTYNPPEEFGDKFRACFFIFDVIKHAKDSALYIDPDVVCVASLKEFPIMIGNTIGIFELDFPLLYDINGISREQANQIWTMFLKPQSLNLKNATMPHIGGEAIFIPSTLSQELAERIEHFWAWNICQAINDSPFLTTEEHILTQILRTFKTKPINIFLSRIWTAKTFSAKQGNSLPLQELLMWHLPSEKSRGFIKIYKDFIGPQKIYRKDRENYLRITRKIFHIDFWPYLLFSYIKKFLNRLGDLY